MRPDVGSHKKQLTVLSIRKAVAVKNVEGDNVRSFVRERQREEKPEPTE